MVFVFVNSLKAFVRVYFAKSIIEAFVSGVRLHFVPSTKKMSELIPLH